MKVTGMNRTTEQRNLLRIYSIDKKENSICLQICSNKTEEKIEESQKKGDSDMAEFDYEVVNGRKIRVRPVETVSEVDENGYFVRQPNHFTEGFGEGKNPVEAGRYRLVWAKLCHWSNRASIVRELLGLDEAISVNMVDHAEHEKNLGWEFVYDKDNVDPVLDIQFLSEAYYKADDDYTGRTTVPALIDVKTGKVVNNDYHRLTNYFEVDFKPFHKKNAPDLYPEELRKDIDEMNDWLFDNINNGVYKTTFCRSKEAYWDAYNSFYAAMDLLEERLENQRFLFGDYVTDSDVRLYVTLARLDIRYTHQLGHTKHPLFTYKNLWAYARDLYQIPAFKNNTYFKDFANPVSIARRLSKEKVNNILVGEGAEKFAHKEGFERKNMLTDRAKIHYRNRVKEVREQEIKPYAGHDTVGMVCLDQQGKMTSATSTSGLFMKKKGRVGDSPIAGSGFYVDSSVGGASATGLGEDLMKGCISYEIVRLMAEGMHPQAACEKAVNQLDHRLKERRGHAGDLSLIAMNNKGEWGVATNIEGFSFAVATENQEPIVYLTKNKDGKCIHEVASQEWLDHYMKTRMAPLEEK